MALKRIFRKPTADGAAKAKPEASAPSPETLPYPRGLRLRVVDESVLTEAGKRATTDDGELLLDKVGWM
jgi:hypothetical protein